MYLNSKRKTPERWGFMPLLQMGSSGAWLPADRERRMGTSLPRDASVSVVNMSRRYCQGG
jgi:hypothetical protein